VITREPKIGKIQKECKKKRSRCVSALIEKKGILYVQEFSNIEIEHALVICVNALLDGDTEFLLGNLGLLIGECIEELWISSVDETKTVSVFVGPLEVQVVDKGVGSELAPSRR
jgi:hypothetical protein